MREAKLTQYELTFILGEAATAEQGTAKTKEVSDLITKMGGSVEKDEQWGKRDLAYPINRNRSGLYVTLWFTLPGDQVRPLEQSLRFDETVIRSLVTKAYTTAQPGTLYPVPEEEKPSRGARKGAPEGESAEEDLRRHTGDSPKKAAAAADDDSLSDEDRLKQLDEVVDELLKDEVAS